MKQISLTIPENLYEASRKHFQELGYRNLQEFILDLVRKKVMLEKIERYKKIEERMKAGIGVKRFDQKSAGKYLRSL
ncbi:MAG: hypothetical protein V1743_00475 [Nanoarchaeota archaeon]